MEQPFSKTQFHRQTLNNWFMWPYLVHARLLSPLFSYQVKNSISGCGLMRILKSSNPAVTADLFMIVVSFPALPSLRIMLLETPACDPEPAGTGSSAGEAVIEN